MSNCGKRHKTGKKNYMDGGLVSPRKAMAMGFEYGGMVNPGIASANRLQRMINPMRKKGMM